MHAKADSQWAGPDELETSKSSLNPNSFERRLKRWSSQKLPPT
jgi:hypothetical protein